MILRRVIAQFRKQEWTAIAIDFVIVVLGVFLGLQVSNWNAGRADRASERQYLGQLREDLRLIEGEVRAQIEFEQFQSRLANDIADEIEVPGPRAERKISAGLAQLTVRRTLRVESPTFANLQGSGRLEIISDPDLRAAIISCFFRTSRLEAAIDKNNQHFVDQGLMQFMRNEGLRDHAWDEALMGAPLPSSIQNISTRVSDAARSRLASAGGARPVLDQPDLKQRIIAQLSWRVSGSARNEGLLQHMLQTVQVLDEKLAARFDADAP